MFLFSPQDELYIVKFDEHCDSKYFNTYLIDKKFRTFNKKNKIITKTLVHNAEYSGGSAGCCKCCSGIYQKK